MEPTPQKRRGSWLAFGDNRWVGMKCEATLQIGDKTEVITDEDLTRYATQVGLDRVAEGRYTRVFVLDLLLHERFLGVEAWAVVEEIRALEEGRCPPGTRPASQFRRHPLRGIWHKHYFCARFVAKNMLNQLPDRKVEAIVKEILGDGSSVVFTDEMATQLAHRLTIEQIEKREAAGELTGEWIVFAKHGGQNYYLCLTTHDSGDQAISDRIKGTCFPQFPFLSSVKEGQP